MRRSALILAVLLASCSGRAPVHSDFDPTIDFPAYRSFRLVRPAVMMPPDAARADQRVLDTIFDTIEQDLLARGLSEPGAGAQLNVSVTVHVGEQTGADRGGYRFDVSGDRVDDPVYQFRQGTLVIDFFDAFTDQLVWRGWAQDAVSRTDDFDLAYLARVVEAILAQYPPSAER